MSVVVNDLKVTFFKKYGITPTVKTVKGGTVEIYPDITAEKLVQLIAIASGVFRVVFAFERGYADVEQNVLESLINYDDLQRGVRKKVQQLFGKSRFEVPKAVTKVDTW